MCRKKQTFASLWVSQYNRFHFFMLHYSYYWCSFCSFRLFSSSFRIAAARKNHSLQLTAIENKGEAERKKSLSNEVYLLYCKLYLFSDTIKSEQCEKIDSYNFQCLTLMVRCCTFRTYRYVHSFYLALF